MTTTVVGGTGKTGARVANRLRDQGTEVRIASRSASGFDWDDPATWPAAVDGARAAYVAFAPDIGFPGAAETVSAFVDTALAHGCGRVVLLSGRGEAGAQATEKQVFDSRADVTVVRAAFFAQNFSESFILHGLLDGMLVLPARQVAEPFVDVDDIADVAVAALNDDAHIGQTYELTGPELITFADAAALIGSAIGRDITYLPVSVEQYREGLPADVPPELADLLGHIFDGHNAHVADGVGQALGREPRRFADYVRACAATGVWSR